MSALNSNKKECRCFIIYPRISSPAYFDPYLIPPRLSVWLFDFTNRLRFDPAVYPRFVVF
ncbi:hypothetical protein HOLDEFILI_02044 [Holdemania filiformis DSM 12042]|uniref:Uncharacterized protein n=1 Tax=Holdemania filiformis DSM 12042 TaxID=545696 RepID=B9Y897_9FIRM|nr:hypothetical protein HOLDEFILI_02044 [Holdemania filiformis DSM 12042]